MMCVVNIERSNPGIRGLIEFIQEDKSSFLLRKLKFHHRETYLHSIRVFSLCAQLFELFRIQNEELETMLRSALLHDIGKLMIGKNILDKQEPLEKEEWNILKNHCQNGVTILNTDVMKECVNLEMILYHHENLDGTGYFGINNNQLSMGVKILRVADSFDAMIHTRAYSKAKSVMEAFEELYRWSGIHYEPEVVDALYKLKNPEMNIIEQVDQLKLQLIKVFNKYGQLTHPKVLEASQELDQALNVFLHYSSR